LLLLLLGHLEYSTNLSNWIHWTDFRSTNTPLSFRDTAATNSPQRFTGRWCPKLGLEDELRGRAKRLSGQVVVARPPRQESTMSLKWIAERLQMGTWTCVSNLLNQKAESSPPQEVLPLCQW
jgi:hypothetical protein